MALPSRFSPSNPSSCHFDFEHIEAFREVAQCGNLTSAASAFQLSKSAVSKYMTALESQVGVKLLNRSIRFISLTDAGALLLQSFRDLDTPSCRGQQRQFRGRTILVGNQSLSSHEVCTSSVGSVPEADFDGKVRIGEVRAAA